MSRLMKNTLAGCVLIAAITSIWGGTVRADVCSEGIGIPPFMDAGVDPNLLLAIDNSGSMLDMAYTDPALVCLDDGSYLTTFGDGGNLKEYAGNFDRDKWYEWDFSPYAPWISEEEYQYGDRVYTDGIIYEMVDADMVGTESCEAAGNFLVDDTGCVWKPLVQYGSWVNGNLYNSGTILLVDNQLYRNTGFCEADDTDDNDNNGTIDIYGDKNCVWTAIDSTYDNTVAYLKDDIVTFKGMFFEAQNDVGAGVSPGGDAVDNGADWDILNEGRFVETTVDNIATHCDAADGDPEYIDAVGPTLCLSLDNDVTPARMTQFVANGNFMNWLSASKLDIQKEILTGGKHDYPTQLLISENRGCSGKAYTKQVGLNSGRVLTLRTRGKVTEGYYMRWDQIDSVDDTTRIEVLAITDSGYESGDCEAAVERILGEEQKCIDQGKDPLECLNGTQQVIDSCLEIAGDNQNKEVANQRAALNHALQYCWQKTYNLKKVYGETGTGSGSCYTNYGYIDPDNITPWHNAYHCYGVYDENVSNAGDRVGYVGRCWQPAEIVSYPGCTDLPTCEIKPATDDCDEDGCVYPVGDDLFKNQGVYNWKCNTVVEGACFQDMWSVVKEWSDDSGSCGDDGDPPSCAIGDPVYSTPAWAVLVDGNGDPILDNEGNEILDETCIEDAMDDYCADFVRAEIIDPSEDAGITTAYGNLPANLVDAGVLNQLGVSHPLAVMKGYIEQTTRPEGILHTVADKLRMGAMAFNDVGAETECKPQYVSDNVVRYCPKENLDGARLITPIESGSLVTGANDGTYNKGERWHVDDLAESINGTRGTSWTPLAEAVYTGVGYYTQNDDLCINIDANGNCDDLKVLNKTTGSYELAEDPVQYWCQENHIIIITEGESTADINAKVAAFVGAPSTSFDVDGDGGLMEDSTDDYPGDADGDIIIPQGDECSSLIGSTYLDDLTYWGQHAQPLYDVRQLPKNAPAAEKKDKRPITTHMVTTGSLGTTTGANECDPQTLMTNAAINGDTTLYAGEDPDQLEENLEAALASIIGRASAGSAASVISSSRSGEGAVYQAVFWREIPRATGDRPLTWVGDVHGLFIDNLGRMWDDFSTTGVGDGLLAYDDADGDGLLSQAQDDAGLTCLEGDRRVFIFYDGESSKICFTEPQYDEETKWGTCNARSNDHCLTGTEVDVEGVGMVDIARLDNITIQEFKNYLWSAQEGLTQVNDVETNRSVDPATGRWDWSGGFNRRYIFTWNDINNDGEIDRDTEILPLDDSLSIPTINTFRSDFGFDYPEDMISFVRWFRGSDGEWEDTDGDGIIDSIDEDIDNDNNLDVTEDIDQDGNRDVAEDVDSDGNIDVAEDVDGDNKLDVVNEDIDGDGKLDVDEDFDNNGVLHASEDLDCDGNLDPGTEVDADNDGLPDVDFDSDGNLDDVNEDANGNLVLDVNEDLDCDGNLDVDEDVDSDGNLDVDEDVDGDNKLDLVNEDIDSDGRLDLTNEDIDNDGKLDTNEDVNRDGILNQFSEDINGNGIIDYVHRCRRFESCYDPDISSVDNNDRTNSIFFEPPIDIVNNPTWRLGDIIHSTPKLVAQPAEGFSNIYRDASYAWFKKRHQFRRQMIYFGGNDGMLHAVNGGYFDVTNTKFWEFMELDPVTGERCYYDSSTPAGEISCTTTISQLGPTLGTEMWAYVPYNLQPHLQCLSEYEYRNKHKYFVDKEPRIFDMKIFEEEKVCTTSPYAEGCIHPGGWGTVLVGAMRFGGSPVDAQDGRRFISSYFVLDITDPERPPELLGEMTMTTDAELWSADDGVPPLRDENGDIVYYMDDEGYYLDATGDRLTDQSDSTSYVPLRGIYANLGYTTPMVTGAVMRDDWGETKWYLLFGNGPTNLDGENYQQGKIAVLPMAWLIGPNAAERKAFRIPNAFPDAAGGGVFMIEEYDEFDDDVVLSGSNIESFTSDLITLDLDVQTETAGVIGGLYKSDAVYFGTVDGTGFYQPSTDEDTDGDGVIDSDEDVNGNGILETAGASIWNGGGRVFRLVMRKTGADGHQDPTSPAEWRLEKLIDARAPVSGAPSAGWDGANFWIYFGTGRFFSTDDKKDYTQNYFFGIKEPLDAACEMTWNEILWDPATWEQKMDPTAGLGQKGLFRADHVLVPEAATFSSVFDNATVPTVYCPSGSANECDLSELDALPVGRVLDPGPNGTPYYSFDELTSFIAGEGRATFDSCPQAETDIGIDGWFRVLRDPRERVLGQSTLLGGLNTFTTYQPSNDECTPEGTSSLYGVYYQTGTAWYENVFGRTARGTGLDAYYTVDDKLFLGPGLSTTPSIHSGRSDDPTAPEARAFIQTSTGEIKEIDQENLPLGPPQSGMLFWTDDPPAP